MLDTIQGISPIIVEAFEGLQYNVNQRNELKSNNQGNINRQKSRDKDLENKEDSPNNNRTDFNAIEEKLRSLISDTNTSISLTTDPETKKLVIKIIDTETKEVIRQLPPEVSLKIARIVSNAMKNQTVDSRI